MLQAVDIAVAYDAALIERAEGHWSPAQVRRQLDIPKATLSKALERLREAGIVREAFINRAVLAGLLPLLPSLVPARPHSEVLVPGLRTGVAAPGFQGHIRAEPALVWQLDGGPDLGLAIPPLHPRIPARVHERQDPAHYGLLAFLDAIRGGRAREVAYGVQGVRLLCGLPPSPGITPSPRLSAAVAQLVEDIESWEARP